MRIRLQYILFVLLIVAVGTLCRVQNAQRVHAVKACAECCLAQTLRPDCMQLLYAGSAAAGNAASGWFFAHSLFAPELGCCTAAQNNDSKVTTRVVSLFGHDIPACPPVAGGAAIRASGSAFRGVDYYVYMLGKIRI